MFSSLINHDCQNFSLRIYILRNVDCYHIRRLLGKPGYSLIFFLPEQGKPKPEDSLFVHFFSVCLCVGPEGSGRRGCALRYGGSCFPRPIRRRSGLLFCRGLTVFSADNQHCRGSCLLVIGRNVHHHAFGHGIQFLHATSVCFPAFLHRSLSLSPGLYISLGQFQNSIHNVFRQTVAAGFPDSAHRVLHRFLDFRVIGSQLTEKLQGVVNLHLRLFHVLRHLCRRHISSQRYISVEPQAGFGPGRDHQAVVLFCLVYPQHASAVYGGLFRQRSVTALYGPCDLTRAAFIISHLKDPVVTRP